MENLKPTKHSLNIPSFVRQSISSIEYSGETGVCTEDKQVLDKMLKEIEQYEKIGRVTSKEVHETGPTTFVTLKGPIRYDYFYDRPPTHVCEDCKHRLPSEEKDWHSFPTTLQCDIHPGYRDSYSIHDDDQLEGGRKCTDWSVHEHPATPVHHPRMVQRADWDFADIYELRK